MLNSWMSEFLGEKTILEQEIVLLCFYETILEKQTMESMLHLLAREGNSLPSFICFYVSSKEHKKLVESCEISRTPTLLFWYRGMEIARFNRISSSSQLQAALESIQLLQN